MAVSLGSGSNFTTNSILGLDDLTINVVNVERLSGCRGRHSSGLAMGNYLKTYIRCRIPTVGADEGYM